MYNLLVWKWIDENLTLNMDASTMFYTCRPMFLLRGQIFTFVNLKIISKTLGNKHSGINQSINQSINQTIKQSINQSINQSLTFIERLNQKNYSKALGTKKSNNGVGIPGVFCV